MDVPEITLTWKKPQTIFVNSMSDLFHEEIPLTFIRQVFEVMAEAHWLRFQVLTKRADRLAKFADLLNWPENVWMGVTVEKRSYVNRIDYLRKIPAAVLFLSLEPLLGPLPNMDLSNIDWAIVGGESGPSTRQMDEEWVLDIQQQCRKANMSFFFKQWGGVNKKKAGRLLKGRAYSEIPNIANAICPAQILSVISV